MANINSSVVPFYHLLLCTDGATSAHEHGQGGVENARAKTIWRRGIAPTFVNSVDMEWIYDEYSVEKGQQDCHEKIFSDSH